MSMKPEDKKGEVSIVRWDITKLTELDSQIVITIDKENITKLIYGLIGLTKDHKEFYLGFNLPEFGVHFVHREPAKKIEEPKQN